MEQIEEENKHWSQLSNHCFAAILAITGGLAGLVLSGINSLETVILFVFGLYFDCVCAISYKKLCAKIENNIRKVK